MSIISKNTSFLKTLVLDFSRLRVAPALIQVREKGHLNRPKLRNPFWFVRKNRVIHDDNITPENKGFIKEIIHENYGPPAIISGVQTYDQTKNLSLLKAEKQANVEWTPQCRRTGLLARKIGQYPLWLKNGQRIRTTLLHIVDNHVIKYIPPEEFTSPQKPRVQNVNKFGCLLVGAESADPSLLTKEYCGLFKDSGVMPKKNIGRFLVTPDAAINPGTRLDVTHFRVGDYVDVRGKTVPHGFQGVVKRHGFKGMPASHGVTKTHRRPGNIGGGGEKGRVWPGTRLPGHMGNTYRKIKGLRIWRINTKYNVMWVQGSAVPGVTNGLVYIYDTILPLRRPRANGPPVPTNLSDEESGVLPEDIWFDDVHCFKDPTITYEVE